MTLVLGLRCADGVVLAADSQRTEGQFRQEVPKLFATPVGIVWGTAGTIAIQQELFALLRDLDAPTGPPASGAGRHRPRTPGGGASSHGGDGRALGGRGLG